MKKILYTTTAVVVFATVMVSCKDNNRIASEYLPVSSTSELQEFREWQAEKLEKENEAKTRAYTSTASTTARRKTVYRPAVATTTPAPAPAPAKKKGWSKAAKGAVIGGAVGAGAGALILKKNRALGAVIGGVVGGGVGYGVGRSMDKKDGRVQ